MDTFWFRRGETLKPILLFVDILIILPALKLVGQAGSFIAVDSITHEALIL